MSLNGDALQVAPQEKVQVKTTLFIEGFGNIFKLGFTLKLIGDVTMEIYSKIKKVVKERLNTKWPFTKLDGKTAIHNSKERNQEQNFRETRPLSLQRVRIRFALALPAHL